MDTLRRDGEVDPVATQDSSAQPLLESSEVIFRTESGHHSAQVKQTEYTVHHRVQSVTKIVDSHILEAGNFGQRSIQNAPIKNFQQAGQQTVRYANQEFSGQKRHPNRVIDVTSLGSRSYRASANPTSSEYTNNGFFHRSNHRAQSPRLQYHGLNYDGFSPSAPSVSTSYQQTFRPGGSGFYQQGNAPIGSRLNVLNRPAQVQTAPCDKMFSSHHPTSSPAYCQLGQNTTNSSFGNSARNFHCSNESSTIPTPGNTSMFPYRGTPRINPLPTRSQYQNISLNPGANSGMLNGSVTTMAPMVRFSQPKRTASVGDRVVYVPVMVENYEEGDYLMIQKTGAWCTMTVSRCSRGSDADKFPQTQQNRLVTEQSTVHHSVPNVVQSAENVFKTPETPKTSAKPPQPQNISSVPSGHHSSPNCTPVLTQEQWEFVNSPQVFKPHVDTEKELEFWVPDADVWKQEQERRSSMRSTSESVSSTRDISLNEGSPTEGRPCNTVPEISTQPALGSGSLPRLRTNLLPDGISTGCVSFENPCGTEQGALKAPVYGETSNGMKNVERSECGGDSISISGPVPADMLTRGASEVGSDSDSKKKGPMRDSAMEMATRRADEELLQGDLTNSRGGNNAPSSPVAVIDNSGSTCSREIFPNAIDQVAGKTRDLTPEYTSQSVRNGGNERSSNASMPNRVRELLTDAVGGKYSCKSHNESGDRFIDLMKRDNIPSIARLLTQTGDPRNENASATRENNKQGEREYRNMKYLPESGKIRRMHKNRSSNASGRTKSNRKPGRCKGGVTTKSDVQSSASIRQEKRPVRRGTQTSQSSFSPNHSVKKINASPLFWRKRIRLEYITKSLEERISGRKREQSLAESNNAKNNTQQSVAPPAKRRRRNKKGTDLQDSIVHRRRKQNRQQNGYHGAVSLKNQTLATNLSDTTVTDDDHGYESFHSTSSILEGPDNTPPSKSDSSVQVAEYDATSPLNNEELIPQPEHYVSSCKLLPTNRESRQNVGDSGSRPLLSPDRQSSGGNQPENTHTLPSVPFSSADRIFRKPNASAARQKSFQPVRLRGYSLHKSYEEESNRMDFNDGKEDVPISEKTCDSDKENENRNHQSTAPRRDGDNKERSSTLPEPSPGGGLSEGTSSHDAHPNIEFINGASKKDRNRNLFASMQTLSTMGELSSESGENISESDKRKPQLMLSSDIQNAYADPRSAATESESQEVGTDVSADAVNAEWEQEEILDCFAPFAVEPLCYSEEDLTRHINTVGKKDRSAANQKSDLAGATRSPHYTLKGNYRSVNGERISWYTRDNVHLRQCSVKMAKLNVRKKTIKVHRCR